MMRQAEKLVHSDPTVVSVCYLRNGLISMNIQVKVKVNFTLEQFTKAQRGSRGTALLFL
jgi:hypothetical protein